MSRSGGDAMSFETTSQDLGEGNALVSVFGSKSWSSSGLNLMKARTCGAIFALAAQFVHWSASTSKSMWTNRLARAEGMR